MCSGPLYWQGKSCSPNMQGSGQPSQESPEKAEAGWFRDSNTSESCPDERLGQAGIQRVSGKTGWMGTVTEGEMDTFGWRGPFLVPPTSLGRRLLPLFVEGALEGDVLLHCCIEQPGLLRCIGYRASPPGTKLGGLRGH